MTSVLEKLRKMSDLHRLRGAVKRAPTPAAFADLAERYISLGKIRDASRIAKRGLALFPSSERLASISTYLRKDGLKGEISRLKKQAATHPAPAVFNSLAHCYLELGDHERTLAICDECASRYPLNEKPYLVAGEVHAEKFFQHILANDGIEGEALLRRALRLNAQNLKARLILAQLYYAIGALDHFDAELAEIRRLSPDYEDLMIFRTAMEVPAEEDPSSTPGPSTAERCRAAEANRRFVHHPGRFPLSALTDPSSCICTEAHIDKARISDTVIELASHQGITNVMALGPDGRPVNMAGGTSQLSCEEFAALAAEILDTASDATRKMEFGALDWCTIEGDFGGITVNQLKGVALAASFGRPLKVGPARRLVGEFAARSLSAEGEG